jgi:putative phage-type endonuclease
MNYSVKNFVKKNCTETYTLNDIEDLAGKISEDSEGRYTNNSAMKILCRYAYVSNGKIEFNVDARNFDQTVDNLKKHLNLVSGNSRGTNTSQNQSPAKSAQSNKPIHLKQNLSTQNQTMRARKGGFGNLSSARNIIKANSVEDEKPIKKENKSLDIDESPIKIKTQSQVKSTSVKSIKKSDSTGSNELQRNTSLFSSANSNNNNNKSISNKSIKSTQSLSTGKTNVSGPKKGGFGVLKKSLIHNHDPDDGNVNRAKKSLKNNNGAEYKLPTEGKFKGLKRTDKLYGPYGTDNYHDENIVDDEITDDIAHRVEIYRKLAAKYYPAQRSKEWFEMRDEMITASDGGVVVGLNPYEYDFGFVQKKVFGKPFETSIDCYHGKKYEQAATMVYEYRMNVRVKEFGLCRHPEYNFLGASPDGIVSEYKQKTRDGRTWEEIEKEANMIEDPEDRREYIEKFGIKTKFVGRMLEIKCPFRRKILMDNDAPEVYGVHGEHITNLKIDSKRGVTPSYYWVQTQLQLQCCELDECDFFQTTVFEYPDREDFLEDTSTTPWLSKQGGEKSCIIQILPFEQVNNKCMPYCERIYNYSDWIYPDRIDMTPFELDAWILDTIQNLKTTHKGFVFESIKYYKIFTSRNITIKRNDKWFADNLSTFRKAWDYVEYFRENKDKAQLLKRYINTFPLDCYKKVKEPLREKGIIMKTLVTLASEPEDNDIKNQKIYARFIAQLEQKIIAANIDEPKDYDVIEDVSFIKEALNFKIPNDLDLDDDQKKELEKKHVEFVKTLKNHVQNYLFQEKDDIFD